MDIYRQKKKGGASGDDILAAIAAKRAGKSLPVSESSGANQAAQARGRAHDIARRAPADSSPSQSEATSAGGPSSESSGAFASADDSLPSPEGEERNEEDEEVTSGRQFNDAGYEILSSDFYAGASSSSPRRARDMASGVFGTSSPGDEEMEPEGPRPPAAKKDEPRRKTGPTLLQKHEPRPSKSSSASLQSGNDSADSVDAITSRLAGTTLEASGRGFDDSVATERKASGARPAHDQRRKHRHVDAKVEDDVAEADAVAAGEWHLDELVVPAHIHAGLYPHQKEGVAFLWRLHKARKGGILGDDMGLGKTRQIVSYLASLFNSKLVKNVLLVVPGTLLPQWMVELASVGINRCVEFSSSISVPKRAGVLYDFRERRDGGVMLTTYEMVGGVSAGGIQWDYLVLDEGHLVKNPGTKRFMELKALPFEHCILLTGTPVQNHLKELWALYDMCCPGLLGDKTEFKRMFENPIVAGNEADASKHDRRVANVKSKALREKIAPYFLRRMKREIFPTVRTGHTRVHVPGQPPPLPLKTDLVVWLALTNRQSHVYEGFLESDTVKRVLAEAKGAHVLTAITALKKICDHPGLLKEGALDEIKDALDGATQQTGKEELADISRHIRKIVENPDVLEDPMASCKIKFLVKLLKNLLKEGHRVLIFSQSKIMLDMTEKAFRKADLRWLRIDGTVKPVDRERRVQQFQAGGGADIFMMTSQVGGLGLTLHAADRVVVLDPAWNPSVDNQSVDRAYRLGQRKDVVVYRLITCETVEDKIYKRQVMKDGLVRSATGNQSNQLRYFTSKDVAELLSLPNEGFRSDKTMKQMEARHGEVKLDEDVQLHLDFVKGIPNVVGLSHHDLLYTIEDEDTPDEPDFHEGTEMRPVGTYPAPVPAPAAPEASAGGNISQSGRKPLNYKNVNRAPAPPPGILQAAKAGAPLHAYAPAPAQRAPVPQKPAPTLVEVSMAQQSAKRADEGVAKLDMDILKLENTIQQRTHKDDEFSMTLKERLEKKQAERASAAETAVLLKAKYEALAKQVPGQAPAQGDDDDDVVEVVRPSGPFNRVYA